MTQVNIHSGAIGTFKTTNWIIPSIQADIANGIQVVLSVPSKTSQNTLAQHFNQNDCLIINCDTFQSQVVDTLKSHLASTVFKVLIITHDALKLCNLNNHTKGKWRLYIDEAINPYNRVPFWASEENVTIVNWAQFITLTEETNKSYIKVNAEMPNDSWSQQVTELRQLTDSSWTTWTTQAEYDKFAKGKGCVEFAQELNIDIIQGWESVNIAAAAFEHTFMHKWMVNNGFTFNIIKPFDKSKANATVYTTNFFNSATLQKNSPTLYKDYNKKLKEVVGNQEIVVLRNKTTNKTTFKNEYMLPHNMAGQNSYNHITHASFEAANNPPPMFNNWLKEVQHLTDDEIITAGPAYLAYQFFGRTAIRNYNDTHVTLACFCNKVMVSVFDNFIDNSNDNAFNVITLVDVKKEEAKLAKKAAKPKAKTAAERMKEMRKRDKQVLLTVLKGGKE